MTIAIDANVRFPSAAGTTDATTGARTWTHTPTGTPKGVLVLIVLGGASTDVVSDVSYGGVTCTEVVFAVDTAGEAGAAYIWHLGASIPTGAQTVSVTRSGTNALWCYSVTFTASQDTEIADSGILQGDQANPQIALDSGANGAFRYAAVFSGLAAPSSLTPSTTGGVASNLDSVDFGNQASRMEGYFSGAGDQTETGSITVGYTAASDDVAMVAAAIIEAAAPAPASPGVYRYSRLRQARIL